METSILRFVRIDLVSMLGMADSHSSYGTCISREKAFLRMSMAEIKPPDLNTKVLFGLGYSERKHATSKPTAKMEVDIRTVAENRMHHADNKCYFYGSLGFKTR